MPVSPHNVHVLQMSPHASNGASTKMNKGASVLQEMAISEFGGVCWGYCGLVSRLATPPGFLFCVGYPPVPFLLFLFLFLFFWSGLGILEMAHHSVAYGGRCMGFEIGQMWI